MLKRSTLNRIANYSCVFLFAIKINEIDKLSKTFFQEILNKQINENCCIPPPFFIA